MKASKKVVTICVFLTISFILGIINFHLIEYAYWQKDVAFIKRAAAATGMPSYAGSIINVQECNPAALSTCPNCGLCMSAVGNACGGFTEIDFNPQPSSRAMFNCVLKGYMYYGGRSQGERYPQIGAQVISTGISEGIIYIAAVSSPVQGRVEKVKNFVTDYIIAGFKQ